MAPSVDSQSVEFLQQTTMKPETSIKITTMFVYSVLIFRTIIVRIQSGEEDSMKGKIGDRKT